MKEIIISGKSGKGKFVLVDDQDYEYLNRWKWFLNNHGYVARNMYTTDHEGRIKHKNERMHRIIMQTPVGMETDHINGNKIDNRRENLRICTRSQN